MSYSEPYKAQLEPKLLTEARFGAVLRGPVQPPKRAGVWGDVSVHPLHCEKGAFCETETPQDGYGKKATCLSPGWLPG